MIALALSYPLIRPALVEQQHTGLAGTMVTPGTRWTEVGRAATPSGSATASIRRSGASVEVHVRLAREGTVEMQWDPAALELRDSAVRGDRLGILCPGGVCPAVLFRAAGAAPAGVTVTLQGGERLSLAEATPGP